MLETLDPPLTRKIIGAAVEVHRHLGPGLLESAYEVCLAHELQSRKLKIERQKSIPVRYKEIYLACAYRLDLIVEDAVIIEIKAIEQIAQVHKAQLLSYMKIAQCKVGLILNFNVPVLKQGICRLSL